MALESVHLTEAEGGDLRWEGWARRAVLAADHPAFGSGPAPTGGGPRRQGLVVAAGRTVEWEDFRLSFLSPDGQAWRMEGSRGRWDPDTEKVTSNSRISLFGPGIQVEGEHLTCDISAHIVTLGDRVTASIQGFWIEQR